MGKQISLKDKSPDFASGYERGYQNGYRAGYGKIKKETNQIAKGKAYWIMRKGDWYCSNCNTKNEQKHNDYCCKCGYEMSEEAL